jgi:aryl-alcohol dehydrogenase-like predicted oxidoreductase
MKNKPPGKDGPAVGRLGYGAMVLEGYYGASEDETAVDTLCHAIDSGMMIDSADAYGNGHNEELLARAIRQGNADRFIATKFGLVFDDAWDGSDLPTGWGFSLKINGTPDYARHALDQSLQRLGVESIDLWYAHYLDPSVAADVVLTADDLQTIEEIAAPGAASGATLV